MPFLSQRSKLQLTDNEIKKPTSLSNSRTAHLREVERAKILLSTHQGLNDSQNAKNLGTNRQKVIRCINKAFAYGIDKAINDNAHSF